MWKKIGFVFVGVYTAAILYLNIVAMMKFNGFSGSSILSLIIMLLPAVVIASELAGKKVPAILTIMVLLITAVFFLGSIKFNTMGVDTLAKAVLFGITILLLGFFAFKRILKKKR